MRPARLKKDRWRISSGELDHHGKTEVTCRKGDREFLFCRGWRGGKDVWVCCERVRMLANRILQPPDRVDAEQAASAARAELERLEPGFGVYLDLACDDEETKS
jgi:hypothetical protein